MPLSANTHTLKYITNMDPIAVEFDAEISKVVATDIPSLITEFNTPLSLNTLHVSTLSIGFSSGYDIDLNSFDQATCDAIQRVMHERIDFAAIKSIELNGLHVNPRARKERKAFSNARIVKARFHDGSRTCFNVFCTGSVQVKGCKSATKAQMLCEALLTGIHGFNVSVYDPQIQLINSNFSIGRYIDLTALSQRLKDAKMDVSYEPEKYLGLKWSVTYKQDETLTIAIFQRGSVIVTGAKTPNQLLSCYAYVANYFVTLFKDQSHTPTAPTIIKDPVPIAKKNDPKTPTKRGRKRKAEKDAMYDELALELTS